MRTIPSALDTSLRSGATTLCWCWRVARRDGVVYGFSDHDRDLTFDGTTFEAASGLTASAVRESVGLDVDNFEVDGALVSDRLNAADLVSGVYDGAEVTVYRVDWLTPANRVLIRTGVLGEVKRTRSTFAAEVRGLAHELQQQKGRSYQYTCDAIVGDARCTVALANATFRGTGTIASVNGSTYTVNGISSFATGWFSRGLLTWTGGANSGRAEEVKVHAKSGSAVTLQFWNTPKAPVAAGDGFTITAGCDKHFETCKAKFANTANYRGFPHMPGNDFVTSFPSRDDGNLDGGSLVG